MKDDLTKIAHLYNDGEWHIQTNEEHCNGVAELASEFAAEFCMAEWGHMIGILHDRGKDGAGFQAYIRRRSGYDPAAFSTSKKDHSHIGAILAHRLPFDRLFWLSNSIAGHHRGLYDMDELELILNKSIPEDISQEIPNITLKLPSFRLTPNDASHLNRMLFSCLVDADWLDTERFMNPDRFSIRGNMAALKDLDNRLHTYLEGLKALPSTPINELRNEIQSKCEEAGSLNPGFFELTVPTGGGKTIASVIWAIKHALKYRKKRLIIAIPFTSIIVQTAEKLREIFGEENVIEHHSAMNESSANERTVLTCENWDAPIVVTTNVQLFESMFSNKPSACRKLHNMVNSVVILDEVQTLPLTFLQPIVSGMVSYTKLFGTSFLFCTASQPILNGKRSGCNGAIFEGIDKSHIRSIISEDMRLHDKLRRVRIDIQATPHTYESLAYSLKSHKRVLCVVSSRRHALELYNALVSDTDIPTYHLSRSMCSEHILDIINEIKQQLANPQQEIRVVSTQLIEAGVDIDFPVVFRQLSGLDSILQAAGRCNREGRSTEGITSVFSFKGDRQTGFLQFATDTMKDLISLFPNADWLSPDTMRLYYEKLYHRTPSFDREGICGMFDNLHKSQYQKASEKFQLINEVGTNVIINYGGSDSLIRHLAYAGPSRKLSRQLGKYSVNLPQRVFNEFDKAGLIIEPYPGYFYIPLIDQYDVKTGLKMKNELIEQTFII